MLDKLGRGKIWVRDDMQAGGCLHRFQWSRGTPSCTSGGQRKEWEVKEILFHPKYDLNAKKAKGIPEFYDYDVALVRLKEKLKYETTIR